jgi:hypothetical protein
MERPLKDPLAGGLCVSKRMACENQSCDLTPLTASSHSFTVSDRIAGYLVVVTEILQFWCFQAIS